MPDNAVKDLNLRVPGVKHYGAWASATRHKLVHETLHPALTDANRARTKLGVGEQVDFRFEPTIPNLVWPDILWDATGGGIGTTNDAEMIFFAPSNAANVTVVATVKGQTLKEKFKVVEPSGVDHADIVSTNHFPVGNTGVGMHLRPYVAPGNVSFYRITVMEVGENATGVTGWFTNVSVVDLSHIGHGADDPIPVMADNSWDSNWDFAYDEGPVTPVGYGGGYTWNIPARWWIGSGPTNSMTGWNQVVTMDSAGTMTIEKFGRSTTRTVNDVISYPCYERRLC